MELGYNKVLVTGAAGFIGFHLSKRLLDDGYDVTGIDNMNDYYDVNLKRNRLSILSEEDGFTFVKAEMADRECIRRLFDRDKYDVVVNFAAQPGVRYSLINPSAYIDANIVGFLNILEGCRHGGVRHLVYASSSSVYGANKKIPFSVHDNIDHPVSIYAATKKSNELMAHAYSHLYGLPCTGLRFFTVYGPWGRPDMAYFLFTNNIIKRKPIKIFNNGKMKRDFTYIDDIIEAVTRVIKRAPTPNPEWNGISPDPGSSYAPYKIYNIGANEPIDLMDFVETIEEAIGIKAEKEFLEMQAGDIPLTYADVKDLEKDIDFKPKISIRKGIHKFIDWYRKYYNV